MLLYAITDRSLLGTTEGQRQMQQLATLARAWAVAGVDYVQVREKDLQPEHLFSLTRAIVSAVREACPECGTRVLLNVSNPEQVAVGEAAGADGTHIACGSPSFARLTASKPHGLLSVGCHSLVEVEAARECRADLVLFAPVFEKRLSSAGAEAGLPGRIPGKGLRMLEACCGAAGEMPVLALGGVTAENAADCLAAGAAGIAGIRLFLDDGWRALRLASDRISSK